MLLNNLRCFLTKQSSLKSLPRYYFAIRKQFLEASFNEPSKKIIDINNGCIYFKDPNNQFSYMKQFTTDNNNKGVIVDIRQKYSGGVLYSQQNANNISSISPTNHHASLFSSPMHYRNIYNINEIPINELNNEDQIEYENFKNGNLKITTSKTEKIPIFDPLVDLCYPIYEGDFKVLEGGRKTGKSQFLFSMIQDLLKINYKVIYFNLNQNECMKLMGMEGDWIAFTETEESAGSLFLAYKIVKLAECLVGQGENVIVVMENIGELLRREETVFSNFGQPVAPFSIVNSLFGLSGKTSGDQTTLTTFLTIQETAKQESSPNVYSNSLKHIRSLSNPIKFPLQARRSEGKNNLSQYINRINQQKNQIDEKKLFKIPVDSYDYYFYYDSPWWIKSLKKYKADNKNTLELYYKFLEWNIEKDYSSQWEIPAEKAFKNFLEFVDPSVQMFLIGDQEKMGELLEQFLVDSRIKGHFSPFKKDYL